jgi:hypothetical protein
MASAEPRAEGSGRIHSEKEAMVAENAEENEVRTEINRNESLEEVHIKAEGPDTTSFAAFLLSLLSIAPSSSMEADSSSSEYSEDEQSDEDAAVTDLREENTKPSSSYYSWSRLGLGFYGRSSAPTLTPVSTSIDSSQQSVDPQKEDSQKSEPVSSSSTTSSYLSWLGFSRRNSKGKVSEDKRSLQAKSDPSHFQAADHSPMIRDIEKAAEGKLPATPRSPLRLPELSEESFLLTQESRLVLYSGLPALAQGREWVLLYR